MGCNPSTLLRLLVTNGSIPARQIPLVALLIATTLLRWPFSTFEKILVARSRHQAQPMRAPIFIVGHWRSGTTYLYNVLSQSPEFAYRK
ncbi:MAG: sulfotransferase [Cyanothece sp. SIO1E1]|nr:sulfotransferase [Cyanothece sp. SIO1E1]